VTGFYQHEIVHPFAGLDASALIETRARQRGDHPLLIWAPFDSPAEVWSYSRFHDDVARVAGGLAARGIKAGDRVLVHLENCPETLIARFAIAWLGAVAVISNAHLTGPELAQVGPPLQVRGAITQPKLAQRVADYCTGLEWIAVTATDAGAAPDANAVPAKAERFSALFGAPMPRRTPDPAAPAMILFTTGSTARPKAVLWTHANILWGGKVGALQQGLRPDDIYQVHLPLFHVVGFTWSLIPAYFAGATILLQPRFSVSRFWPAALAHRATVASHAGTDGFLREVEVPPHHFRQWLFARHDAERNDYFRLAGAAGWGMTEMIVPAIASDLSLDQRPYTVGRAYPGYEVRIEREDGSLAAPGEPGHLLIGARRGVAIFQEYVDNPSAMAEAFDERGFFRTGDRVIRDEGGWITYLDRIKDVIKVGGENVSATEVETAIMEAGGVREVAVVARPDKSYGEVTVAYVVLGGEAGGQAAAIDRLMAHCRANLAKFKVPRAMVPVAEIPKIGNNKINRPVLREMAKTLPA
jgi:crotonobetaine/carnitine-CoA ligase